MNLNILKLKHLNYKIMKVSRIYPYNKTEKELRHEHAVATAKKHAFKHPGSKTAKTLHGVVKNNL